MGAVYRQYKAKGLEVLFAAVNPSPDVPGFVQRFQVPFPMGVGDERKARDFMQFSAVRLAYVPWLVFLDRKGVIRAQYSGSDTTFFNGGEEAVRKAIDPLLAEGAAAAPRKAAAKAAPKK